MKPSLEDVFVVTVAGNYQSGKSFMINMLGEFEENASMTIGNSIQSETIGIWMPDELVIIDEEGELRSQEECKNLNKKCKYILFNDMEGYGSIGRSEANKKLFTFGLRSADLVIFNMKVRAEEPHRVSYPSICCSHGCLVLH